MQIQKQVFSPLITFLECCYVILDCFEVISNCKICSESMISLKAVMESSPRGLQGEKCEQPAGEGGGGGEGVNHW